MAKITEIAPEVFRISIYAPWGDLQFNHFLVPRRGTSSPRSSGRG